MWSTDTERMDGSERRARGSSRRNAFCGTERGGKTRRAKATKEEKGREQSSIQKDNANHTTIGNEFITGANKPRFYNKNRCQTKSTGVVDTIHT